ncbi:RecQ family ATP-dependent DNA helicase [Zunongwangia sp.]|uniref:RecQ family ATP-dependent DNA helicase n=1 Tax=Zunongwangia sp. TaxID=1965325 RepID=UPI003AA9977B
MQEALHILKKYWEHSEFRPMQYAIIEAVVAQKNVLGLLPTGGGKSICFQIPALLQDGICIVVSPLIALMEDQVNSLLSKNIKAMALTGSIKLSDLDSQLDNCIYGNYKFLYLSPERLQNDLVQARIKLMNVNLLVIDEAHCISQWGHDFRPAYRNISVFKELKPRVPLLALTATATPKVIADINTQLDTTLKVFQQSFFRANISYKVTIAEDKYYKITSILTNSNSTAIIYVRNRHATLEIAAYLQKLGYQAAAFHGGLKLSEKKKKLKDWLANKFRVMVATNAFGMGIDKPDVRHVIHFNLPENLESYYQEAGRAGRDGNYAEATIITNTSDKPTLENQFLAKLPSYEEITECYRKLFSYFGIAYGEGYLEEFNFNFNEFCRQYRFDNHKTFAAFQILERCGLLKFNEEFRSPTLLKFSTKPWILDKYLDKNPRANLVVKSILRTYGGIFDNKTAINISSISDKTNITEQKIQEILNKLAENSLIELTKTPLDALIMFLVPREDSRTLSPHKKFIQEYLKDKTLKINQVLQYIDNTKTCRSKQLLSYFGEEKKENCGICSVCTYTKETELNRDKMNSIYLEIAKSLKQSPKTSRQLVEALNFSENHILEVLRLLLEKERISRTNINTYKLNRK